MPDLAIGSTGWNGDLLLTNSGDLATVNGSDLGTQRVTRRFLTAPKALLFHPDYGFGLPQRIGTLTDRRRLLAQARAQIFKERAVARLPSPQLTIDTQPTGAVLIRVRYADRSVGTPHLIQFAFAQ